MTTDLTTVKTKSGKAITDFQVPEDLINNDPELVALVMGSESMDDAERQYWFNLWLVMNAEQVEKLRDILTREKKKLAEIEAKYAKEPEVTPEDEKEATEEVAGEEKEGVFSRFFGSKDKVDTEGALQKAADAGFVPCALVGIRQTFRCPCPIDR